MRSILVFLVILGTGFLFFRLTRVDANVAVVEGEVVENDSAEVLFGRYFLTLSDEAASVEVRGASVGKGVSGEVSIDEENPVIFLQVKWRNESKRHKFTKLVLEVDGQKTSTHVFDASGDIDDFVELDF